MKPNTILSLLLVLLCAFAGAEEKPVHTFDRNHGVGKLVFGSAPHHLRAAGLEIKQKEISEDERLAVYELADLNELELGDGYRASLYFLDDMLYRVHVHPAGDPEAEMLERLAARLNSEEDMQTSDLFRFSYSTGPRHIPGHGWVSTPKGLIITSIPLSTFANARSNHLQGRFERFEQTRRQSW